MNKKKLLSLALAVIMIAILSFGTLAWFSDSDDVTNNFYIASSDDPSDPDDHAYRYSSLDGGSGYRLCRNLR